MMNTQTWHEEPQGLDLSPHDRQVCTDPAASSAYGELTGGNMIGPEQLMIVR